MNQCRFVLTWICMLFIASKPNLKKEGETCGSCFSPDTDYDCGVCGEGLECKDDSPTSGPAIADLPKKCKKAQGMPIYYETFSPSNI